LAIACNCDEHNEPAFGGTVFIEFIADEPKQNKGPETAYATPEPFVSASP
jgi:hypothetical protein